MTKLTQQELQQNLDRAESTGTCDKFVTQEISGQVVWKLVEATLLFQSNLLYCEFPNASVCTIEVLLYSNYLKACLQSSGGKGTDEGATPPST